MIVCRCVIDLGIHYVYTIQTCALFSPAASLMAAEATTKHTINATFPGDILTVVSHHLLVEDEAALLLDVQSHTLVQPCMCKHANWAGNVTEECLATMHCLALKPYAWHDASIFV